MDFFVSGAGVTPLMTRGFCHEVNLTKFFSCILVNYFCIITYATLFFKAVLVMNEHLAYRTSVVPLCDNHLPQDGVRMDDESTMQLLRALVKLGCEPRSVGYMSGGASPMDPIFWVLHQMFEKAMHILWLSPHWRDTYNMEWVDGSCNGSKLNDQLPFTGEAFFFSCFLLWCCRSNLFAGMCEKYSGLV